MKFNDKIAKILHFLQVTATKNFFIPFIAIRKPIYCPILHLLNTERNHFKKIVFGINKNLDI